MDGPFSAPHSFGEIEFDDNVGFYHRFSYTGREFDADTGLYYYRARWYDPVTHRFISEDPIGFEGGALNLGSFVANDPGNSTDPSGLVQERPSEARKRDLLARASHILKELRDSGAISNAEAALRYEIIRFALNSPLRFSSGGWRNSEYWTDEEDADGQYTVRPGKSAADAIADVWITPGYKTGCLKAAELIILRGIVERARTLDKGKRSHQEAFDKMIGNGVPSDAMDKFGDTTTGFYRDIDFRPGDRGWMRNRYFYDLTPEQRKNYAGEEGSNVIYIGSGLYVSYDGTVFDRGGLQKYIRGTFGSVPRHATPDDFLFRERFRPHVPSCLE